MRLSKFILSNLEPILEEWEKFARTLVPASQKTNRLMLRDDVKNVLKTMAADLVLPESNHHQAQKSKGRHPETKTAASTHGSDRLASGFSLIAAMAEYRALRASVIRLWEEAHANKPQPATALDDMIRFNEAIDQAISESVQSYSNSKDRQTRVLDTILSSSPDLNCTFDLKGKLAYANRAMTELLGLPLDKVVGKNFFDLNFSTAAELQGQIKQAITSKKQVRGEISHTAAGAEEQFYDYIFVPVLTKRGKVEAIAGTARNVTERRASEEKNWQKANFDPLTGLPNRRLFSDRLVQAFKHAGRIGAPIALLFIDLDRFKEANDMFGHEVGDQLLRLVAARLRCCVRETDTVARLGGDEFTVILENLINANDVEDVAVKILKELATPFQIENNTIHISGSIGISLGLQDARTPENLIKNADQAMYVAKNEGRNRFNFFSSTREQSGGPGHQLMNDLRVALLEQQLAVYYQPILDIANGRIIKAEALLRWNHPERGLMLPGQFVGPAEEAGLMNEIGHWVFTEAALHSRQWSALLGEPFQISINITPKQFRDHEHTSNWGAHIKSLGLASHSISVDIKEEVLLNETADVSNRIGALHDAGIEVAIDDFGTGNLSIAKLKKLAVDTIKIDLALVHDMTGEASSLTVSQAIIAMAHKLGVKVIAEGVETIDQRDSLQAAGCDYAQGYLFAAPVLAEEFEKLLHPA